MICSWILSLKLATIRSMRLIAFRTARSIPRSQQANDHDFTIWFCRKATLRRKIPGSLYWQSSIFENLLLPTTKTIQKAYSNICPR